MTTDKSGKEIFEGVKGINLDKEKFGAHDDINHLEGIEKFDTPMKDYFKYADDISKVFALNMGIKLKIFDTIEELGDKALSSNILAKLGYKTNNRHFIDFLDQLYVHNLLERDGILETAKYRNSDYTKKFLLKTSLDHYNYLFLNLDRYLRKYQYFEKNFPSGKTQLYSDDIYSNEEDLKSYMEYFYKSNNFNFEYLLSKFDFSKFKKVVDIHGLSGCLAIKIKQKFPACDVYSYDNKKIKDTAETKLRGKEMQEIVKLEYGDLYRDNIPQADCVIAPHVLMNYSMDNKKAILKRIYDNLYENGELIIMENLIDENRHKDDCGLKISFMFGMMGYEGFAISFNEYRDLLKTTGFTNIDRLEKTRGVSDIIIAKKTQLDKSQ